MAFLVVYDASVLYPNTLRDLLIRLHQAGLVQAKWSDRILDEALGALARNRPDIAPEKIQRLRVLMATAVRDHRVSNYESLIDGLELPDPDDRHVLAAAIRARAQVIVTANLKDFPAEYLATWDIEAKGPDEFVVDQISLDRQAVYGAIVRIADARNDPPQSVADVLAQLQRSGLIESVAELTREQWV